MKSVSEEFEELMGLFLFGELIPEDEARLKELLLLYPEFKTHFARTLKMDAEISRLSFEKPIQKINYLKFLLPLAAILTFALSLFLFFPFENSEAPDLTNENCKIQLEKNYFSIASEFQSDCSIKYLHGHSLNVQLSKNSQINFSRNANRIVIELLKGKIKIKSNKLKENSILHLSYENFKFEFLGTEVIAEITKTNLSVLVLDGSVKQDTIGKDDIFNKNEVYIYTLQSKVSTKKILTSKEVSLLQTDWKSFAFESNEPKLTLARKIEKIISDSKPVLGSKLILKSGEKVDADSIYEDKENYILLQNKKVKTVKKSDVEKILFK